MFVIYPRSFIYALPQDVNVTDLFYFWNRNNFVAAAVICQLYNFNPLADSSSSDSDREEI